MAELGGEREKSEEEKERERERERETNLVSMVTRLMSRRSH